MPHVLSRLTGTSRGWRAVTITAFTVVLLAGCTAPAYTLHTETSAQPPLPSTQIFFYPKYNQAPRQQDRDRYECYLWAVKQSGFDPGQASLAPHQRIVVTPAEPPGTDIAAGAVGGAVLGSIFASPHDSGQGMVFGAITGAMLGAASDAAKQQQAQRLQQHYDMNETRDYARMEKQARDYRRAMTACLEGRGYTVQ
jgi:hypothetical protein